MNINIALLQINPKPLELSHNLQKGLEYCVNAKKLGADIILFPEMWSIGYAFCPVDKEGMQSWEESAITKNSNFYQAFSDLAKELNVSIAISYLESVLGSKPRNTVSVIGATGETLLDYSKVFICDFGKEELTKESPDLNELGCDYNCAPGESFEVAALNLEHGAVNIGAMICADREFPEISTKLFNNGAEILLIPNSCTWDPIRKAQLQSRAFEILGGVAMSNYPSPKCNGFSSAYDCIAWNNRDTALIEAGEEEGIYLASFNMDLIRSFRKEEQWRVAHKHNFANLT
ncbi:MAG: carbon-nitrogen hydrolase family protein [Chloroflexota bacterium]